MGLSRSVSVSRINEIKKENPDEEAGLDKDDEEPLDHLTPSPKPIVGKDSPKVNVRKRREKFEPKNRARNVKELAKESRDFRRNKPPIAPPKKETKDPFKNFMDEMRGEFQTLNDKFNNHTKKISKINDKVDAIERQNEKTKAENKKEFEQIRKEMSSNRQELEESIKISVIESLKPNVSKLQAEVKSDLKKLVRVEVLEAVKPFQDQILELSKPAPAPPHPDSHDVSEEAGNLGEKQKPDKKKKKAKNKNSQK